MDRVVGQHVNEKQFDALVAEVAMRKKDPYSAVNDILASAGLPANTSTSPEGKR